MLLFPPYVFAVMAVIGFVLGYLLSWFTGRSVRSIGTGVAGVVFAGCFILDWTIPRQAIDPIWFVALLGAVYALVVGVPSLLGANIARNLREVVLK